MIFMAVNALNIGFFRFEGGIETSKTSFMKLMKRMLDTDLARLQELMSQVYRNQGFLKNIMDNNKCFVVAKCDRKYQTNGMLSAYHYYFVKPFGEQVYTYYHIVKKVYI